MHNSLVSSGILFILSSPSGAGKSTIAQALTKIDKNAELSISYTTRTKRDHEKHGREYYFVDHNKFLDMVATDSFLEYAMIYDKLYGTPKSEITNLINDGKDIVFDIDCQGYRSIKKHMPSHVVSIFILPPSLDTLKERIIKRGGDSTESIEKRMSEAIHEISHHVNYDYIVVNDELEKAVKTIHGIMKAERRRKNRINGLEEFICSLGSIPLENTN